MSKPISELPGYNKAKLRNKVLRLRLALDAIKVRAYELGQKELHDMALDALND